MIITQYEGIVVPNKIRNLLKQEGFALFFLTGKEFRRLCKFYHFYNKPTAFITMDSFHIFVDGEHLRKYAYTQANINFILLHEIAHGILEMMGESNEEIDADLYAYELADELNIPAKST